MKMDIDKVIEVVKNRGPLLPNVIAKHFNTQLLIASATLSQLVSLKKVKLTHSKIGGSPLYYVPGQEEKLPELLQNDIKKEYKPTFDKLKDQNVLWDKKLPPKDRIALRNLKDFAKPWLVKENGNEELFWVWSVANEEDIKKKIEDAVHNDNKKSDEAKKIKVVKDEKKTVEVVEKSVELQKSELKEPEKKIEKKIKEETPIPENKVPNDELKKEMDKSFSNVPDVNLSHLLNEWSELKKKVAKLEKENKEEKEKRIKQEKQSQLVDEPEVIKIMLDTENPEHNKLSDFLEKNNIVINEIIDMKKTSIGFSCNLETPVGVIPLWTRVLLKKRINDKDIEALFGESNLHRLQGLLLYSGEFTKKAIEVLEKYKVLNKKIE